MKRIAILLIVILLPLSASARGFPGASFGNGFASPSACTILAGNPFLSNNTFPSGSGAGVVVGAVSVTTSGNCAGLTQTLSITGANTGGFTLSGTTPPANLLTALGSSAACGSGCSVTIQIAITGAVNSPSSQTYTVTATAAGTISLTPTFHNPTASNTNTLAQAFWAIGFPFTNTFNGGAQDDLPTGKKITCAFGASSVPCSLIDRKLASDGSVERGTLLVDFTGISIPAAGSATLTLTSTTGSFTDTSSCTDANWEAAGDVLTLSNLGAMSLTSAATASGSTLTFTSLSPLVNGLTVTDLTNPSAISGGTTISSSTATSVVLSAPVAGTVAKGDMIEFSNTGGTTISDVYGNGTWTFTFDGGATNTINVYGASPQGRYVQVIAQGVSNAVTPHRNLTAEMDYWVTEKADGTCASTQPIEAWGPYIHNNLLHLTDSTKSNLTAYVYDAAFVRNAVTVRSYAGTVTAALTTADMGRPDAQGDFFPTTTDPGVWVSWDVGQLVATRKIPPFTRGVTYVGGKGAFQNAPITGLSGAVFTIGAKNEIFASDTPYVTAVEFSSVGSLTGVSTGTVYYAVFDTGASFWLYDTLVHALAKGATGQVSPGGTIGAATLVIDAAPGSVGPLNTFEEATGPHPDISMTTEWGAAYTVGGTQAWARLGRVAAHAEFAYPYEGIEATTAHIPCLLAASGTANSEGLCPTSGPLATAYPTAIFGPSGNSASSPNVNSGKIAAGGLNGFSSTGTSHHANPEYVVWLMEGTPALRDLVIAQGNGVTAMTTAIARRTVQIDTGTKTYYGTNICTQSGISTRASAWWLRDVADAAMAATQGSAEETYFRTILTSSADYCADYATYEGASYAAIGLLARGEQVSLGHTLASQGITDMEVEGFMSTYLSAALGWATLQEGDYISGLGMTTTSSYPWLGYFYNGAGCPFYATAYVMGHYLSDLGASGKPIYISPISANVWGDLGINAGSGAVVSFSSSSPTVTMTQKNMPWILAAGDGFRMTNSDTGGNTGAATTVPPSPFLTNVDYFIGNPNQAAKTFQLYDTSAHAIAGGSTGLIQAAANATGVNGYTLPFAQTCPPTGVSNTTISGTQSETDASLIWQTTALALLAESGVTGAGAAYTTAAGLLSLPVGGDCTTQMDWCMAPP